MKATLTHVTADGIAHTRTTAHDYTHVVVASHEPGSYWHDRRIREGRDPDAPFVASWHSRRDLAERKASQMREQGYLRVTVEAVTGAEGG